MAHNYIKEIPSMFLSGLSQLKHMDLSNNKLEKLPELLFASNNQMQYLKSSAFSQCCFVKKERPDVECITPDDSFSDCDRMIKSRPLQNVVWVFVVVIFATNLIAFILRIAYKDKAYAQNAFILNLNIGDFLMGVYIAAISNRDLVWQGDYYLHDHEWRSSVACKFVGAIALISSEVCVMTLAVITYDRREKILRGIKHNPMRHRTVWFIFVLIWLIAITIAIVPAVVKNYFYEEEKAEGYYGTNALCLPLQLPGEKDTAWEYCLVIFGIFNFLVACYMAWAYCTIFHYNYVSARASGSEQRQEGEVILGIRFFAIVFTDILCWFPIAILIYISLAGMVSDTENILYAWFSICVVSINSAINPIIYTITNTFFWPKIRGGFENIGNICQQSSCCNQEDEETDANQELNVAMEMTGITSQPRQLVVITHIEPLPDRALSENKGANEDRNMDVGSPKSVTADRHE